MKTVSAEIEGALRTILASIGIDYDKQQERRARREREHEDAERRWKENEARRQEARVARAARETSYVAVGGGTPDWEIAEILRGLRELPWEGEPAPARRRSPQERVQVSGDVGCRLRVGNGPDERSGVVEELFAGHAGPSSTLEYLRKSGDWYIPGEA